ncbi:hypothetical protein M431DRAFT_510634 [Trichoderma harzianum CBS 226.95]|uniref:Uncharacterized protein n=1 Tax=Trichoderma harzianum CBS 226.95 TaxID=983964 RepID=A0A2T4A5Z4_TRIHA|nr:hypothetical protein M431DRAFT_510634 [Trichoderma harzianum CBS 226.95]PTB52466.1 hypothetical protein M431DRAFT_510634 [Trichoderma harzianum CBS 226.95]
MKCFPPLTALCLAAAHSGAWLLQALFRLSTNQRRRLHQTSYRRPCGTFIPETALIALYHPLPHLQRSLSAYRGPAIGGFWSLGMGPLFLARRCRRSDECHSFQAPSALLYRDDLVIRFQLAALPGNSKIRSWMVHAVPNGIWCKCKYPPYGHM